MNYIYMVKQATVSDARLCHLCRRLLPTYLPLPFAQIHTVYWTLHPTISSCIGVSSTTISRTRRGHADAARRTYGRATHVAK